MHETHGAMPNPTDPSLVQDLQEAEDLQKYGGDDQAWKKSFVRLLNQAAMQQVHESSRSHDKEGFDGAVDDDNVSIAGKSDAGGSVISR